MNQEGLPDYWGIETRFRPGRRARISPIRKDYPTTGVLKPRSLGRPRTHDAPHQEGLPDYWGIETLLPTYIRLSFLPIRKDYPTTGVLKLNCGGFCPNLYRASGRITRLLGY